MDAFSNSMFGIEDFIVVLVSDQVATSPVHSKNDGHVSFFPCEGQDYGTIEKEIKNTETEHEP